MCFPSIAPKQLGKFHRSWNYFERLSHSSSVEGTCMKRPPITLATTSQTSSTIIDIACRDIRNWKAREWNDSPVAKNLRVRAIRSAGAIASLMHVSSFAMKGDTRVTRRLKWPTSIRTNSLKLSVSSTANSFRMPLNAPNPDLLATQSRTQTLLLTFFRSLVSSASKRKTKAAAFRFAIFVYIGLVTAPSISPACCAQCCIVCPHLYCFLCCTFRLCNLNFRASVSVVSLQSTSSV